LTAKTAKKSPGVQEGDRGLAYNAGDAIAGPCLDMHRNDHLWQAILCLTRNGDHNGIHADLASQVVPDRVFARPHFANCPPRHDVSERGFGLLKSLKRPFAKNNDAVKSVRGSLPKPL